MTNRNTCAWKLAGPTTFRLASSKTINGKGTNLQNPSDRICRLYIPDKGKVFVNVDQSGAEALVVSYLTTHGRFRDLFLNKIKSHCYIALRLFSKEWDTDMDWTPGRTDELLTLSPADLSAHSDWKQLLPKIKHHETRYFLSKKTCHASNYGMQGNTFQMSVLEETDGLVNLSKYMADLFLQTYHDLFPEIKVWHNEIVILINTTKVLRNLFGYPREFNCLFCDDAVKREALAFIPQSTVGTITNIAFVELQDYIEQESKDWDLLNNKHDSFMTQVPIEEAEEAAKVKIKIMEKDLVSPRGEKFKMKAEAQLGYNWGHWDEKENPEGLKDL